MQDINASDLLELEEFAHRSLPDYCIGEVFLVKVCAVGVLVKRPEGEKASFSGAVGRAANTTKCVAKRVSGLWPAAMLRAVGFSQTQFLDCCDTLSAFGGAEPDEGRCRSFIAAVEFVFGGAVVHFGEDAVRADQPDRSDDF